MVYETNALDSAAFRLSARTGEVAAVSDCIQRARDQSGVVLSELLSSSDDLSGNTALHYAAANGHIDVVGALLEAGAPLESTNSAGSTPLHYCSASAALESARVLLSKGANPLALNTAQATPLDDALRMGGPEAPISKLLLDAAERHSADVDGPLSDLEEQDSNGIACEE